MSTDFVYAGAAAPYVVTVTVTSDAAGPDLSTATAATVTATSPDGAAREWAATLSAATATSLLLTHALAAGDVPVSGPC